MADPTYNVLLIEDSPGDARLIREMLAEVRVVTFKLHWAERLSVGLERLRADEIDIVLLDLSLPDSQGIDTFKQAYAQASDVPIVILSDLEDEKLATKAVRMGAQDYLVKGHVTFLLLVKTIRYAIERKQAQELLRDSEQRLRLLADSSSDYILMLDTDLNIQFINRTEADLDKEEMIGTPVYQYAEDHDKDRVKNILEQVVNENKMRRYETTYKRPDGTVVYFETGASPIQSGGKVTGVVLTARDITERKEVEAELQKSEEKYRQITEGVDTILWEYDILEDCWTYVSPQSQRLLGYAPEEWTGLSFWTNRIHKEDRQWASQYCAEYAARGESHEFEYRFLKKNGEVVWLRDKVNVEVNDGVPVKMRGFMLDITERKQAEERLQKINQQLQASIDQMPTAYILWDTEFHVLEWNNAAEVIFGYTREEALGENIAVLIVPKPIRYLVEEAIEKLQNGESVNYSETDNNVRKDGTVISCQWHNKPLVDDDGNVFAILSIAEDVTERKQAEEALRQYAHIVSSSSDMLAILDTDYIYNAVNNTYLQSVNLTSEQLIGHTAAEVFGEEFFNTVIKPNADRCLAGEEVNFQEWVNIPSSGKKYMDITYYPYIDVENKVQGFVVNGRDFTKRKQAEKDLQEARDTLEQRVQERTAELSRNMEALQLSETRLGDAQRMAHMGNWDWDIAKNKLWWSDNIYHMFGAKAQEFGATHEDFLSCVHADDREFVQQSINEALHDHKPYSIDFRIVTPDAAERIVHEQAEVTYDADGNPIRMMGTVQDITVRKQVEEELLKYQKQLQSLASELTLAEEHERRSIAEGLHDQVGQLLTAANLKLEYLEGSASMPKLDQALSSIQGLIQQAIQYTRSLTFELSPPRLYALGFPAAIKWLAEQMSEEHSIQCQFNDDELPKPMADEVQVLLYRVVRELLHNIVKHARASAAKISLITVDNNIQVCIEDNGIGFDQSEIESGSESINGFGLFSARERLNYLKGSLEIRSASGRGTKSIVTVPLTAAT